MKILNKNLKKNEIKVQIENLDDLWYLSHIIEPGDLIKGKTVRKIKIGEKEQRRTEVVKKHIFLELETDKTDFKQDSLRISGKVKQGPEEVPKASYHTFNIEPNSIITITKEKWLNFQLKKLEEASSFKPPSILICILDREEALFAISKRKGYELLTTIEGEIQKKEDRVIAKGSFYEEIIKLLKEYETRYKIQHIIVASPAFWKEELMNHLKDASIKKKIVIATCSSVSKNAINEVLKRPETREVLKQDRIAKEEETIEELLTEIKKNNLATYGIRETKKAADAGAVKTLLVTDAMIQKTKEQGKYDKIDDVMKTVDSTKGEVHIISSEFEAGKKLDGLGGIAALLRYKLTY